MIDRNLDFISYCVCLRDNLGCKDLTLACYQCTSKISNPFIMPQILMLQVKEEDPLYYEAAEFVEIDDVLDPLDEVTEDTSSKSTAVIKEPTEHIVWTTGATKLFLALYKEGRQQVNNGELTNKKDLWYYISNEMAERGYALSAVQAENKLKTLERAYKNTQINKNIRVPSIEEVHSELEDIFGKNPASDFLETCPWMEPKSVMMWTDVETKVFLKLFKETKELLDTGRLRCKKNLWSLIANKMEQKGYSITAVQAENKCKTLERAYKKNVINKKFSINARVRSVCGFEKELDELFGRNQYPIKYPPGRIENSNFEAITQPSQPSSSSSPPPSQESVATASELNIKSKDGKTSQALKMVRDSILNLTRKMDEQLENQKRFIAAQELFHKNVLDQQKKMHLERRRKNDLLEEFLRRKYE